MVDNARSETSLDRSFKDALQARSEGRLDEAIELFRLALQQCVSEEHTLQAAINGMLGNVERKRGNLPEAEAYSRTATRLLPSSQLASVGMFHAFWDQGKHLEALEEVVRLVTLRDSEHYRELLSHGFRDDLDSESRSIADDARRILEGYDD